MDTPLKLFEFSISRSLTLLGLNRVLRIFKTGNPVRLTVGTVHRAVCKGSGDLCPVGETDLVFILESRKKKKSSEQGWGFNLKGKRGWRGWMKDWGLGKVFLFRGLRDVCYLNIFLRWWLGFQFFRFSVYAVVPYLNKEAGNGPFPQGDYLQVSSQFPA